MEVHQDFKELLRLLNDHKVNYLIVGGYALAFHGAPRFTGDLDIFVQPTEGNAKRLLSALEEFGFGSLDLKASDFTTPDQTIQLGVPPARIDLLTSIEGVDWESASEGSVEAKFADIPVKYIGREEFIRNKRSVGRKRDLADLEALGEA